MLRYRGISYSGAIAEQFNDENGLVWPKAVAPFHVHVIPVNMKSDAQREMGENIYNSLQEQGYEVLLDDRAERAGVKFADADLFGLQFVLQLVKSRRRYCRSESTCYR